MGPNPLETADLVTFTGEILNGKLHFLCNGFAVGICNYAINNMVLWTLFCSPLLKIWSSFVSKVSVSVDTGSMD